MADIEIMGFIGRKEGCVEIPYPDGTYDSWGFGHNGPDVVRGRRLTKKEALALFSADLDALEMRLDKRLKVTLSRQQKNALLSAAYNLGLAGIRTVLELVNAGDNAGAMAKLKTLCKVKQTDGSYKKSKGLEARREAEVRIFEAGDYGDTSRVPYWTGNPFKTAMRWAEFPGDFL